MHDTMDLELLDKLNRKLPFLLNPSKSKFINTILSVKYYLIWLKTIINLLEENENDSSLASIKEILHTMSMKYLNQMICNNSLCTSRIQAELCNQEKCSAFHHKKDVQQKCNSIKDFKNDASNISPKSKKLLKRKRNNEDQNKENSYDCKEEIVVITSPKGFSCMAQLEKDTSVTVKDSISILDAMEDDFFPQQTTNKGNLISSQPLDDVGKFILIHDPNLSQNCVVPSPKYSSRSIEKEFSSSCSPFI